MAKLDEIAQKHISSMMKKKKEGGEKGRSRDQIIAIAFSKAREQLKNKKKRTGR